MDLKVLLSFLQETSKACYRVVESGDPLKFNKVKYEQLYIQTQGLINEVLEELEEDQLNVNTALSQMEHPEEEV